MSLNVRSLRYISAAKELGCLRRSCTMDRTIQYRFVQKHYSYDLKSTLNIDLCTQNQLSKGPAVSAKAWTMPDWWHKRCRPGIRNRNLREIQISGAWVIPARNLEQCVQEPTGDGEPLAVRLHVPSASQFKQIKQNFLECPTLILLVTI